MILEKSILTVQIDCPVYLLHQQGPPSVVVVRYIDPDQIQPIIVASTLKHEPKISKQNCQSCTAPGWQTRKTSPDDADRLWRHCISEKRSALMLHVYKIHETPSIEHEITRRC